MTSRKIWLAGAAALALTACGNKDESDAPAVGAAGDAAKLSAASPLEKKFSLKGAEESDIDELFSMLPVENRPTYENSTFDASLGATVVTGLRFADADDGEGVVFERAEFYGLDQAAIDRIKDAEAVGPDAPFETVFEKVRLLNMSVEGMSDPESGSEMNVSIAGIEFDKLSIRQGGPNANPDGDDAANFFNAINLGGLYFKDIDVDVAADDVQDIKFSAPDLRIVGVGGGKVGAILANDLSYDVKQGAQVRETMREAMGPQGGILLDGPLGGLIAPDSQRATIETFEWRDLDFSGALAYGVKGEDAPATDRDLIDLGEMKITDMVSFVNDRQLATVGEISMPKMEFAWMIPSEFRLDMKDAVTDYTAYIPDTEDPAYAVLADNGLDAIKGEGFAEWNWNPDKGDGQLRYEAVSPGLADFSMGFEMVGATLKEMAALDDAEKEDAFARSAELKSFNLKIDDEKALDAIFDLAALQMGGTGTDLRQSAPALIRLSGAQFAQLNPRISDYLDAVANFVSKGGSIEIAATPEEPIGAADLEAVGSPQTLPDVLDLTITHSE